MISIQKVEDLLFQEKETVRNKITLLESRTSHNDDSRLELKKNKREYKILEDLHKNLDANNCMQIYDILSKIIH